MGAPLHRVSAGRIIFTIVIESGRFVVGAGVGAGVGVGPGDGCLYGQQHSVLQVVPSFVAQVVAEAQPQAQLPEDWLQSPGDGFGPGVGDGPGDVFGPSPRSIADMLINSDGQVTSV